MIFLGNSSHVSDGAAAVLLMKRNIAMQKGLSILGVFREMFDKDRIAKLKKGVLIVNNARGAIMDTPAVVDACNNGHIAMEMFGTHNQLPRTICGATCQTKL